ncbi:MAG: GAF domain-containing protein [Chloroflexi bacterium]|nr:GAF domain-containing protein [Chloroflexota bacterium]
MIRNDKLLGQHQFAITSNDAKDILIEALTAVNASLDINLLLSQLAQIMGEAIAATSAYILDWDVQNQVSTVLAEYISTDANKSESLSNLDSTYDYDYVGFSDPNVDEHIRIKQWHVADPNLSNWLRTHMVQYGVKSILIVPLVYKQKIIGSAELWETRYHRGFSQDEVALCKAIADQATIALSNAESYQSELQRRREAEILNDVAGYLTATLDLDDVMRRTVDTIRQYLNPMHSCTISLLEDNGRFLRVAAKWLEDTQHSIVPIGTGRLVSETYASRMALESQTPFVISDLKLHPFSSKYMQDVYEKGIRSLLYIPLILKKEPIGILQIHVWHSPRKFSEEEIALCSGVATQATIAIENARLHAETQQQAKELAILNEVALSTGTTTDIDELITKTTELISQSLYKEMFGFLLVNESTGYLYPHSSYFGIDGELLEKPVPLDHSVVGMIVKSGKPIYIPDIRKETQYYNVVSITLSEIAVPLLIDGSVVAVINAESSKLNNFSDKDVRFLTTLAGQVATAMERAKLYNALRNQAASLALQVSQRTSELQAERDRTVAILESAGEGILFTDTDAKILYANTAMERQSGYSIEELLGQTPKIMNSGQTSKATYDNLWTTVLSGMFWSGEIINKRKDGTYYNVSLTVTPLFAPTGELSGFVSVHSDITKLKDVERLKSEFVSSVTHELRTPLTNIKTYLSLLERGKPEKRARYFEVLNYETERLTRLVQDVLDLSRLESTAYFDWNVSTNPSTHLHELMAGFKVEADKKEIIINCQAPENLPNIRISKEHFAKIILNLLSNALSYTPANGTINIVATEEKSGVRISVSDTGFGIDEEELPHVFDRFYRGKSAREMNNPGTGLGLSITADIIKKYSGNIQVSNDLAKGSCFQIWLPIS